jgi:hypothetical protein
MIDIASIDDEVVRSDVMAWLDGWGTQFHSETAGDEGSQAASNPKTEEKPIAQMKRSGRPPRRTPEAHCSTPVSVRSLEDAAARMEELQLANDRRLEEERAAEKEKEERRKDVPRQSGSGATKSGHELARRRLQAATTPRRPGHRG